MSTSNNIYNILNKLASLEPQPPKQESVLKQLNESAAPNPLSLKDRLARKLQEAKEVDEDMLSPKQEKIAKLDPPTDKIDSGDFAKLRAKKKGVKDEGNEFSGELDKARDAGKDSFKVGGKTYPVKEGKELQADSGRHYDNADDFFSTIEADWLDREEESDDGMEVRGYIDDVNVMVFRYDDESKTSGYGLYDDEGLNDLDEGDDRSWVKDPSDPASKVPAYQRKANEPGRQAAQARADASNAKVGAQVFRSGRPAPMDEDDAYSDLPETRPTSEDEHNEYKAAAHELRKWMRKRGWNTKKEYRSAIKYLHSNLDSKHDDTITDSVRQAFETVMKHKSAYQQPVIDEAGLDMNLLKGAQGAMRGVNTDPESERNRGKKYGYRSDRDDTGNDDDYDEHGNEKKGVKKSAPGDGPKKKGRPKKNFGPERVTAKAYKHKGGRVAEAINLETYVEDTIAEIEALFIVEKAKSKAQQKFMGMVHAAQKGEKPASKEVAKVAKSMGKKDAKDFASTKHKGLPDKVSEGKQHLIETSLQAIVRRFGKEVREFAEGGEMDNDLFEALYDYYFDDMPYGVKKARDGDPYEWVGDHFHNAIQNGDVEVTETKVHDNTLSELAKLAGLPSAMEMATPEPVEESGCNMTAEGQYCPEHGMNECGMMYEAKEELADKDYDEDGKIETGSEEHAGSVDKAIKKAQGKDEEEKVDEAVDLEECGDMSPMGGAESGMSINTSMDTKTGRKTVTVTADGDAAEELAQILKMAGVVNAGPKMQDSMDSEGPEALVRSLKADSIDEYANDPDEHTAPVGAVTASGNDLHKSKNMYKHSYRQSDNPMAMTETDHQMEARLARMLDKIKNS